jgi:hypothetical protein
MSRAWPLALAASALCGCAFDLAHVEQRPAQFDASSQAVPFEITADVGVTVGPGYSRTLRKGSRWMPAGRIADGDVYRSRDQVLTVEASNIHEVWLVVRNGKVVGYYLIVEKTFSPVSSPVELPSRPLS